MVKNTLYIVAIVLAFVLTGCSGGAKGDKPVLVVSVEPQRALLEEIVGDRFDVVSVLTPGSNPETFEPTMKARRDMEGASAFLTTGNLPFEKKLGESLPSSVKEINVTEGIVPVYGTHDHGDGHHHDHGEADPHTWTSVKNSRVMASNMLRAVIDLDPEGEAYYTERFNALDHRLDSLDRVFTSKLSGQLPTRSFAVWHPSLSYFARDYGLEQIAVGFENKEMPATQMARVIDEAREENVKVFFFQKEYDSRQAESLNQRMGTRLVTINPLAYDWETELTGIVDALTE